MNPYWNSFGRLPLKGLLPASFRCVLVFMLALQSLSAQTVSIHNLRPRLDDQGRIVNIHDGQVQRFGETFYWFGTAFGETDSTSGTNRFVVASSDDLGIWKAGQPLLQEAPAGQLIRVRVVFNRETNRYVLWFLWSPGQKENRLGVAVSENPEGPYKLAGTNEKLYYSKDGVGSFNLFTDEDGSCYLLYHTANGNRLSVERLNDDYLSSSFENGGFIAEGLEAGILFRRKATYYLLASPPCSLCSSGSSVQVFSSPGPVDGYQLAGELNRYPGTPVPKLVDGKLNPTLHVAVPKRSNGTFNPLQIELEADTTVSSLKLVHYTGGRESPGSGNTVAPYVLPSLEVQAWLNGRWETLATRSSAMTSSVYTVMTRTFQPVRTSRLRLCPSKNNPATLFLNQLELYDRGKVVSERAGVYLVDNDPNAVPVIVPARQSSILLLPSKEGIQYVWIGDLWGSASDNARAHDYTFWSAPLRFDADGAIEPLRWTDTWTLTLP